MALGAGTRHRHRQRGRRVNGLKTQMMAHLQAATLGEYEILLELGSGGMANVYLAHDLRLDRRVAIKLMHPTLLTGEDLVERFMLEARTAAGLSHPNIVPIHAVKVEEDLLYFVMKYVDGRPLDSIIKAEAPLAPDTVRQIVSQVADALAYAHRHGVIHRDIKPANILISTDGHPILADFGIAKVADRPGLTLTGTTIGTPTYMSPEQCDAQPLTGASDQYSLGVTAFEMLTGRPPFDAPSYVNIMLKHMSEAARPVHSLVPDCPTDLAEVVDRMLAKETSDRFPQMEDVVEALRVATATSQHNVRTQLSQFALANPDRERLQRVSTPRSPIPTGARRAAQDGHGTRGRQGRRISPVIGTSLTLAAVAAAALLVTQPWKRGGTATDSTAIAIPAPGVARDTQPVTAAAPAPEPAAQPAPAATPPVSAPRTTPPAGERPLPPTVSSLRVTGPDALASGGSAVLQASAFDGRGRPVSDRPVNWLSSAPDVVAVNAAGQVQARSPGRAIITATVEGVSQTHPITVRPEVVAEVTVPPATPSRAPTESARAEVTTPVKPPPAPAPAEPSEAERREQVVSMIAQYARALERRDMNRIRELYPAMPAGREQQLQKDLAKMNDLSVRLSVTQVQLAEGRGTAEVTGAWTYSEKGQRFTLPANNRYTVEARGGGWVITNIQ